MGILLSHEDKWSGSARRAVGAVVVGAMLIAGVGLVLWSLNGIVRSPRGERVDFVYALTGGLALLIMGIGGATPGGSPIPPRGDRLLLTTRSIPGGNPWMVDSARERLAGSASGAGVE